MVRKTYTIKTKNKAENLRKTGRSYRKIYDQLQIPKSTLSTWFGSRYPGIFNRKKQLEHLGWFFEINIICIVLGGRREISR